MTPMEFDGVCKAHIESQPNYVRPPTREEVAAWRKLSPDKPAVH